MKKILCPFFVFYGFFFCCASVPASAAARPAVIVAYSVGDGPPSAIDAEPVDNLKALVSKAVARFCKMLRKKYPVRVVSGADTRKNRYANCVIDLGDVYVEYTRVKDFKATAAIQVRVRVPEKGEVYARKFIADYSMFLGPQWPEWVGAAKTGRYALNKVLDIVVSDGQFGEAIRAVDAAKRFKTEDVRGPAASAAPQARQDGSAQAESIEERLMKLKSIKEKGLITEEEYNRKKEELLEKL